MPDNTFRNTNACENQSFKLPKSYSKNSITFVLNGMTMTRPVKNHVFVIDNYAQRITVFMFGIAPKSAKYIIKNRLSKISNDMPTPIRGHILFDLKKDIPKTEDPKSVELTNGSGRIAESALYTMSRFRKKGKSLTKYSTICFIRGVCYLSIVIGNRLRVTTILNHKNYKFYDRSLESDNTATSYGQGEDESDKNYKKRIDRIHSKILKVLAA